MSACARCEAQLEEGDLRCPVCAQGVPDHGRARSSGLKVLRCSECAAVVAYSAEKQNPACGFCGAVMQVEVPVDPVEKPEARLRMTVRHEDARAALKQWLSTRGFFRPSDLAAEATVDSLHRLWWAAWACDADAVVSWTADSNAQSRRSDWAPHAGQTALSWRSLLISASRGLTREETDELSHAYDPSTAEGVPDDDPQVEQFELQRSAARQWVLSEIERDAAARLQQGTIPGSRFRNVRASALLEGLTTRRLALPVWLLSYRYRDKVYRAVVHGQDAQLVIGSSPLSWAKIALVALGGAAVVGLIIALLAAT